MQNDACIAHEPLVAPDSIVQTELVQRELVQKKRSLPAHLILEKVDGARKNSGKTTARSSKDCTSGKQATFGVHLAEKSQSIETP
jgi:hypothetical protein